MRLVLRRATRSEFLYAVQVNLRSDRLAEQVHRHNQAPAILLFDDQPLRAGERTASDPDPLPSPGAGAGPDSEALLDHAAHGFNLAVRHGSGLASAADDIDHAPRLPHRTQVRTDHVHEQVTGEKWPLDALPPVLPAAQDLVQGKEALDPPVKEGAVDEFLVA